tara:strand:+ start:3525 stop:4109 length:585 start_codon:yes stop_codon:yes gene_type:complete
MTVRITKPEINFREKISELDFDKVPYDKMPYGSIIQVTAGETEYRTATSSSSYTATDMYATIVPRFASSKIFITLGGDANNNGNSNNMYITYYRHILGQNKDFENLATNGRNDSNSVGQNRGMLQVYGSASRIHVPVAMPFLDSPNTTSQVTYKVYIRSENGSVEFPSNDGFQRSRMFLFEIASGYTPSSVVGS